jgi:hypothetical protein
VASGSAGLRRGRSSRCDALVGSFDVEVEGGVFAVAGVDEGHGRVGAGVEGESLELDPAAFGDRLVKQRDDLLTWSLTSSTVELLDQRDENGGQWPEPWLSLNPNFESGGTVDELVVAGLLHAEAAKVFRTKANCGDTGLDKPIVFHRHQREAIEAAATGESYVLTGAGSGKSLAYIVPIVDRILRARAANLASADPRRVGREASRCRRAARPRRSMPSGDDHRADGPNASGPPGCRYRTPSARHISSSGLRCEPVLGLRPPGVVSLWRLVWGAGCRGGCRALLVPARGGG